MTIYLPMIPEAVISMLACARIGAVHTVVFGGFSAPTSLRERIARQPVQAADHRRRRLAARQRRPAQRRGGQGDGRGDDG